MAKKDEKTAAAEEIVDDVAAEAEENAEKTMEDYLTIENESLIEENNALRKDKESLVETLQRHQAEFDNFRRRTIKEKDDLRKSGCSDLVAELLPVLDNFERAVEHGQDDPLIEGVIMVQKQFLEILERAGLTPLGEVGEEFDPNLHDAVLREKGDKPNVILEVLQKGYSMHDKLLRPAMVKVSEGN